MSSFRPVILQAVFVGGYEKDIERHLSKKRILLLPQEQTGDDVSVVLGPVQEVMQIIGALVNDQVDLISVSRCGTWSQPAVNKSTPLPVLEN